MGELRNHGLFGKDLVPPDDTATFYSRDQTRESTRGVTAGGPLALIAVDHDRLVRRWLPSRFTFGVYAAPQEKEVIDLERSRCNGSVMLRYVLLVNLSSSTIAPSICERFFQQRDSNLGSLRVRPFLGVKRYAFNVERDRPVSDGAIFAVAP